MPEDNQTVFARAPRRGLRPQPAATPPAVSYVRSKTLETSSPRAILAQCDPYRRAAPAGWNRLYCTDLVYVPIVIVSARTQLFWKLAPSRHPPRGSPRPHAFLVGKFRERCRPRRESAAAPPLHTCGAGPPDIDLVVGIVSIASSHIFSSPWARRSAAALAHWPYPGHWFSSIFCTAP